MNKKLHIILISDNLIGSLIRILLTLNRRNINIHKISLLENKLFTNYFYIIKFEIKTKKVYQIIKPIKKIIGINKIFFYYYK
uniref:acetolactate synthase n=1 Tax=Candidatus Karelsulcia muelleri TaxID=336810 RepID=UPI0032B1CE16